jgi:CheY-like chemotaxis protein
MAKTKILLVDDDGVVRYSLCKILEQDGFAVTTAPVTLEKRTTQANVGLGATSSAVQISVDLAEAKSVPTEVLRILTTD